MYKSRSAGWLALASLLILGLLLAGCGSAAQRTPKPGAPTAPPSATRAAQASTAGSANSATKPSTALSPAAAGVSSYRIHETRRVDDVKGRAAEWMTVDLVAAPFAFHQMSGMLDTVKAESVYVGTSCWTRSGGASWQKSDVSSEEVKKITAEIGREQSSAQADAKTPMDNTVQWLMGQPQISFAKGSLTAAGAENINGIACKHYTVASTYSYKAANQAAKTGIAVTTVQLKGDIWVADQSGLAPFLVRAGLLETTSAELAPGSAQVWTRWLMEEVTDVSSPDVVIKAPE